MTVQSVVAFLQKAGADENLQNQLKEANSAGQIVRIAAASGYNFTPEDFMATTMEMQTQASSEGELSENELDVVTGGSFSLWNWLFPKPRQVNFADGTSACGAPAGGGD